MMERNIDISLLTAMKVDGSRRKFSQKPGKLLEVHGRSSNCMLTEFDGRSTCCMES